MRILTAQEAAELLKVNLQVVRRYLQQGKLPGRKIGKHWRILESELEEFLRRGNRAGEDE